MINYKQVFWASWVVSLFLFFARVPVAEPSGLGLDKLAHVAIFGALTYFGARAYGEKIILLAALLVTYAVSIEFLQKALFPYRSFEIYDIVAGLIGIVIMAFYARRY